MEHLMKFYLFRNLKYLCVNYLKREINTKEKILSEEFIDKFLYDLELSNQLKNPQIENIENTIEELINTNKSCIRLGDGEFQLLFGNSIPFQQASEKLKKHLYTALTNHNNNIITCIPSCLFYPKTEFTEISLTFWRNNGYKWRKFLRESLDLNKIYYSAEITILTGLYKEYNYDKYFEKIKKLWDKKNIAIICGENVFKDNQYNIFDNSKSIEYLYIPSQNAYNNYENILEKAKQIDKNKLILAICGPTATVLCFDLEKEGYRAIDIGHIAKTYDWFIKNIDSQKNAEKFFAVD